MEINKAEEMFKEEQRVEMNYNKKKECGCLKEDDEICRECSPKSFCEKCEYPHNYCECE